MRTELWRKHDSRDMTVDLFGLVLPEKAAVMLLGEIVVAALLPIAVILAIRHRGRCHHWLLLGLFLFDELLLKGLMVQSFMNGSLGDYPYSGTSGLPHIALSIACSVTGIVTITLGFRFRVTREGNMFMPKEKKKLHRLVALVFLASWYLAFAYGMFIFNSFYM